MDDLLELILELIDGLTGHKLDYGMSKITKKLVRNIRNEKLRNIVHCCIWVVGVLLITLVLILLGTWISLLVK